VKSAQDLKSTLDRLYQAFNYPDSATDPIQIVRRFTDPADQEVVGFCAAALAFGRVSSVLQSIERVLAVMGPQPAAFVRTFEPRHHAAALAPIVHRWTRGVDLAALLWVLRQMYDRAGSIEAFFLEGYDPAAEHVGPALDSFSSRALALDLTAAYGARLPVRAGVGYFFPRPSNGSGCKRINLFLRWVVRRDALDLGSWRRVSPRHLVVPLDTHIIRVGRCLRLTRRTSPGWPMALDITAALRQLDPQDPVKYDFAMCHLGMMNACGFMTSRGNAHCPLRGCCHPKAPRRQRKPIALSARD
jgi:uncharacterized protein (TIGR02757 family)